MRAPVSVVIPTLNAARWLPLQLAALAEGLQAGLIREVILLDGGSVDATLAIADQAGAEVVAASAGLGVASGDWLLVGRAATVPVAGWADLVLRHIEGGAGGGLRVKARAERRGWAVWQATAWRLQRRG